MSGSQQLLAAIGGIAPVAATWDPANKSANIALSGGNLIATRNAPGSTHDGSVRGTIGKTSGKWYFEIVCTTISTDVHVMGIGNENMVMTNFPGSTADGWGYLGVNGQKYHSNVGAGFGNTYTAGDVIGIALDRDAGKVWFAKNNTWQASGDPAAGTNEAYSGITSGTIYPVTGLYNTGSQSTIRYAAASMTYSPPSGFSTVS